MYMDDIKLFAKNGKKNWKHTMRIYNQEKGLNLALKNAQC